MASISSFLLEEELLCSICIDVFTKPVSIPCGHNFCKTCITKYWDTNDLSQCPMCKEKFYRRPELHVNPLISEMVVKFRKSVQLKVAKQDQQAARVGEVPCDVCTVPKLKALKSCLVCLISYCETHLEPHQRIAALKRHKLIKPVENLEDRMCKKHEKPLELFCRSDQTCVCQFCTETDHKTHNTVPLEEECGERKAKLKQTKTEVQLMIQERLQKVQEIKHSVQLKHKDSEKKLAESIEVFTALMASIERSQAELIKEIEENQIAAKKQAEGIIKELEREITELKKRSTELEQLLHTEDHLHLLQSFTVLYSPPPTKDWSEISVNSDVSVRTVRRVMAQLEETLHKVMKQQHDVELNLVQQYAVDVTLDPDTVHLGLTLSEDGKEVSQGDVRMNLPDNPGRFDRAINVLGKDGFTSGRFYYEVQVKNKTHWDLGVVRESIDRKGTVPLTPVNGFWTIWLRDGDQYTACAGPPVPLSLKKKPQKVGVFVDYEEGQVSFYDVKTKSHIYSYTGYKFTEKLYPFFSPCVNHNGKNSLPLIITPVIHTD